MRESVWTLMQQLDPSVFRTEFDKRMQLPPEAVARALSASRERGSEQMLSEFISTMVRTLPKLPNSDGVIARNVQCWPQDLVDYCWALRFTKDYFEFLVASLAVACGRVEYWH